MDHETVAELELDGREHDFDPDADELTTPDYEADETDEVDEVVEDDEELPPDEGPEDDLSLLEDEQL